MSGSTAVSILPNVSSRKYPKRAPDRYEPELLGFYVVIVILLCIILERGKYSVC